MSDFRELSYSDCVARSIHVQSLEPRLLFSKPFGTTYTGFGNSGETFFNAGSDLYNHVDQLKIGPAGKLYLGGNDGIARVTADGAIDTTFGTGGIAALPSGDSYIAEAVEWHDRVYAILQSSSGYLLARYKSSGKLDPAFGQHGLAPIAADRGFTPTSVVVEPAGQPVVAGNQSTHSGNGAEMRLYRFNTDGSLDTQFGSGGTLSVQLGTNTASTPNIEDQVVGLKALDDGEIVVGGGSFSYASTASGDTFGGAYFAAAKITSAGQLDPTYGGGGIARTLFANSKTLRLDGIFSLSDAQISGFDVRPDGSAVFSGNEAANRGDSSSAPPHDFIAGFDATGKTTYNVGWFPALLESENAIYAVGGVAALSNGGADVLMLGGSGNVEATGVTSISSTGQIGQTATTFTNEQDAVSFNDYASIVIAASGKIAIGNNYEILELNQGGGFVPDFTGFSNATNNRIDTFDYQSDGGISANETGVAYYDTQANSLMFAAQLPNGLWTTPVAIRSTAGVSHFSLQLRNAGYPNEANPWITYYDPTAKSLKLARSSDGGKTFKTVTIDSSGDAGEFSALQFNVFSTSAPYIVYSDQAHHELKFATEDHQGRWNSTVLDSQVQVGDLSLLDFDSADRLMFAYFDSTTGQIKVAEQRETDDLWDIATATTVKKSVQGLTLSTDLRNLAYYDTSRKELRAVTFNDLKRPSETAIYTIAAGNFLPSFSTKFSSDANLYAYDSVDDSLSSYEIGYPEDTKRIVNHGGAYLQAASEYGSPTLLSYVDSRTRKLVIRVQQR